MSRTDDANSTTLPLWVALCCLAGGALLYFGNTLPALRERGQLHAYTADLDAQQRHLDAAIRAARLCAAGGGRMADIDLQSLFVAIDERGYTIAEFLAANPPAPEPAAPGAPEHAADPGRTR